MKKTIKTILLFIICIMLSSTFVKAEDEACKITLSADKTTLAPGDEVTINLLMEDITKPTGIIEFISLLNVPDDVFEIIYEDDDELKAELGEEGCEILYNGEHDEDTSIKNPWYLMYIEEAGFGGICGASIGDPQKESQIVGRIKLKVKDDATNTQATIKLSMTSVVDAENVDSTEGSTISDSEIKLQIKGESKDKDEPVNNVVQDNNTNNTSKDNTNTGKTNTNNNIKNNTNSNANKVKNTNKQTENKATQDVPYTGIEDWIPFIFLGMVISVIAYINYRKYKDI